MRKQGAATGVNVNPGKAGRSHEVGCDEYLARHSEYLDGLLSPIAAARLSAHAAACGSCARYDRIVRKGIDMLRDLPDVQPSEEFEQRLQHRIFHMEDADSLQSRPLGLAATLGVATAIALLAWSPMIMTGARDDVATGAARENATVAATDAYGTVPLFSQSAWYPMALPAAPAHQPSGLLAAFPGPYSPLVVTPPAHRSVYRVSTEYVPID